MRDPEHSFAVYNFAGSTNSTPRSIEHFQYVGNAIKREKEITGWSRIKKIALIVSKDPAWKDLSADWYDQDAAKCIGPSLRSG